MGGNELVPRQSRIGFAWDESVTEPYAAMLRDHEGRIELVIPYDSSNEILEHRYLGDWVKWRDDPDMTQYNYQPPHQFWFYDVHGFVTLIRPQRAGGNLFGGPTVLSEVLLVVAYAVFAGSPGIDYSRVNGLVAQIEGLDHWLGVRSVTNSLDERRSAPAGEVVVGSWLNLSFRAGARWTMSGAVGTTNIEDYGLTHTEVTNARVWEDHLVRHLALHQLVEVAAW